MKAACTLLCVLAIVGTARVAGAREPGTNHQAWFQGQRDENFGDRQSFQADPEWTPFHSFGSDERWSYSGGFDVARQHQGDKQDIYFRSDFEHHNHDRYHGDDYGRFDGEHGKQFDRDRRGDSYGQFEEYRKDFERDRRHRFRTDEKYADHDDHFRYRREHSCDD
jgi:hypothetical protein